MNDPWEMLDWWAEEIRLQKTRIRRIAPVLIAAAVIFAAAYKKNLFAAAEGLPFVWVWTPLAVISGSLMLFEALMLLGALLILFKSSLCYWWNGGWYSEKILRQTQEEIEQDYEKMFPKEPTRPDRFH